MIIPTEALVYAHPIHIVAPCAAASVPFSASTRNKVERLRLGPTQGMAPMGGYAG